MCTLDRRRSFEDASVVEPSRAELLRTAADYRVELTAYVFMPDHLHAILAFPREVGMKKIISDWKKFLAREHGVRWQRDFFDHRLRNHQKKPRS